MYLITFHHWSAKGIKVEILTCYLLFTLESQPRYEPDYYIFTNWLMGEVIDGANAPNTLRLQSLKCDDLAV